MTTPAVCLVSGQVLFDQNGRPIVGGKIYINDAGTTTPRTTFNDPGLTVPLTYPVLTDGFGRMPAIYIGVGAYKVVLKDSVDALIWSADGLPGGVPDPDSSGTVTPTTIPTGFVCSAYITGAVDGWLVLNGQTIGSPTSGATQRANADTQDLYVALWNGDATLVVSGGRGTSATADFEAGKTISLPDFRGRTVFGRDAMGSANAGVITTASTANPDQLGADLGAEGVILSADELPAIAPTITVAAAGGFTPAGALAQDGIHTHAGTADAVPDHLHSVANYSTKNTGATGTTETVFNIPGFIATGNAGAHGHSLTIQNSNSHTHVFTGTAQPDHIHEATSSNLGSGDAHPNMPPGILVTWYIKL